MIRFLFGNVLMLVAVLTITAAVLLTLARVLLPFANNYTSPLQDWLSEELGQPVIIKSFSAEWQGLGPLFNLDDLSFLDANSGGIRVAIKQARIAIDVPASILNAELRFGNLTISEIDLSLIKRRDGSVSVAGMSGANDGSGVDKDAGVNMLSWLFSQDRLALERSTIHWADERLSQQDLQFVNVNLELRNDGERHQFDGSASLPNDVGRRFSFAADLFGDVFIAGGWGGKAFFNGAGLQTPALLNWLPLAGVKIDDGVAEVRIWSEWQSSRLQRLDGELSIFGLHLSTLPSAVHVDRETELLDSLAGQFSWQRQAQGWVISLNEFTLGRRGHFWPQGNYQLSWTGATALVGADEAAEVQRSEDNGLSTELPGDVAAKLVGGTTGLQLRADYLHVDDLLSLLLLTDLPMESLREPVDALQPFAELRDLTVQWLPDNAYLAIDSDFSELSIHPWQRIPGISGLAGHITADNDSGVMALETNAMLFDAKPLFRQTLAVNALQGKVQWWRSHHGWNWSAHDLALATADAQAVANVDVLMPTDGQPYLDLNAGFQSRPGAVANVSPYLPVGIMSDATVDWLDTALVDGTVKHGGMIFHGPLRNFPFDNTDGQFEVRLHVEDGVLDYTKGWPRLQQLETEVVFSGRQMAINAVSGALLDDAHLDAVQARIENLAHKPSLLSVVGTAHGATAEVLKFLQVSPLRERYGNYVEGVEARGASLVDLDLRLPLAKGVESHVDGGVVLQDSTLMLADGAVDLTELNGRVAFSSEGLAAQGVSGRVMGLAAEFTVATSHQDETVVTTVSGHGVASVDEVREILDPPLFDQFTGHSDWQASLRIPGIDDAGATLQLRSDLRGLATNLPPPVRKPADQVLPLSAQMHFPLELDRPVTVTLGDELNVILDLDQQLQTQRGELRFADGLAQLPERPGLRIAGTIPEFSFSQWWPLIDHIAEAEGSETEFEGLNQISATIADIELFGHHFDLATLAADLQGNIWHTEVDSIQAKGSAQVPIDTDHSLIMTMERLYLVSADEVESAAEEDDPREWPPMRIESQSFKYDDIDYGTLALTTSRIPSGLHLSELHLQSPDLDISAHGDWLVADAQQYSSFDIEFNGDDVGTSLTRFGYADTIKRGKGQLKINARWPGDPLSFALEQLDGNMHLKIENGRLLEVNPGVGRIFGLLSLQALPRRLILDFSDVFSKGFSFDRISGDFDVRAGQAQTTNLIMKGPAAKIGVNGSIGLADQTYDQLVTVVPDFAATVPMLTALTQGAGVGAVVLLLKKLLEPGIDKASMIVYKVIGPWEDPQITRVEDLEELNAIVGESAVMTQDNNKK